MDAIVPEGRLTLQGREKLHISGVTEVLRYDDSQILLDTRLGELTIDGENLKLRGFSPEEVTVTGNIAALSYGDSAGGGFLRRLLGR